MRRFNDERDWFFQQRFGLFVHWGVYAIDGRHEQAQWRYRIARAEYGHLMQRWNPQGFDIEAWLDLAQEAGMTYGVLTTKHHDGFCLWPSAHTDFHVGNTAHAQDIVGIWCDALRRRGMRVGLYYSVVDWHHPNYPNQGRHHEIDGPEAGDEPDMERYQAYLKAQVDELCTGYGRIDEWWWDMNVEETHDPSINARIRALQPSCVINNRGMDDGDFSTPERKWRQEGDPRAPYPRPTEACNAVGRESWGFRHGETYFNPRHLQRQMAEVHAKGGNYLLNVGPDADGRIPERDRASVLAVGQWRASLVEAWSDVEAASTVLDDEQLLATRRGNTLYVYLVHDQQAEDVLLNPLHDLPTSAVLLNTGDRLRVSNERLPKKHADGRGFLRICGLPVIDHPEPLIVRLDFNTPPYRIGDSPGPAW